jgi:hypothetical protein
MALNKFLKRDKTPAVEVILELLSFNIIEVFGFSDTETKI